jgi:hypothetical protein
MERAPVKEAQLLSMHAQGQNIPKQEQQGTGQAAANHAQELPLL